MIRTHGEGSGHHSNCFGCKLLGVQFGASSFKPHYNHSVGKWVSSDQHFRDELKRAGEHTSQVLGMDTDYQPRYPGDLGTDAPFKSSDHVLETRARNISELANG